MASLFVQYGCGLSAPVEWRNYDASPSLLIQKVPLLGLIFKNFMAVRFPSNVRYGNIVNGLPLKLNTVDAVYCSHVLEHLALHDFRKAIRNTYNIMKPGAVFRCVVPDLQVLAEAYVKEMQQMNEQASINFVGRNTLLGTVERPHGLIAVLVSVLGNANHLWMWDYYSLSAELRNAGFQAIRAAKYNDSELTCFQLVEDKERFVNAVAIECKK